jgi:hypothetical protein
LAKTRRDIKGGFNHGEQVVIDEGQDILMDEINHFYLVIKQNSSPFYS